MCYCRHCKPLTLKNIETKWWITLTAAHHIWNWRTINGRNYNSLIVQVFNQTQKYECTEQLTACFFH